MHRRAVHSDDGIPVEDPGDKKKDCPQDCCAAGGQKTHPRKRRKNKKPKALSLSKALDALQDEDLLISLVQVTSGLILVGCGITLTMRWMDFSFSLPSLFSSFGDGMPRQPGKPYPKVDLTPSSYYLVPDSMRHIGDKSNSYALLRKEFDAKMSLLTPDQIFSKEATQVFEFTPIDMTDESYIGAAAGKEDPQPLEQATYDIYNCPMDPPKGYPFAWTLMDILNHWGPDDPEPPEDHKVFQGLCVFDYQKDYEKAQRYRIAEKPFVIQNDPQVHKAVWRWNQPGYMNRMLGPTVQHRAEYSENNHFLYWNKPPQRANRPLRNNQMPKPWQNQIEPPKGWAEPTQMLRMTYSDWLTHANVTDESLLGPDHPHWYFRLIGCGETGPEGQCDKGSSEYLFDELTFFQPKESLYMVEPDQQKGIHCRFGMKGVIAENHFDGSRNAIAVLGGARRYILSHPNQCDYLSLLPKGHPSARHSAVDWSNPDLETFPEFALAKGNEVVMQAGDVLYLPTNWFHYIISLTLNFQCNTRSGISQEYMMPIRQCGF